MIRLRLLSILLSVLLAAAGPLAAGVDRWTPVGPEGGAVLSLSSAPGVIYAATAAGGVFKSTDHGAAWTPASAGLPRDLIVSVAADPTNPAVAYAVADSGTLHKTANGGASWSRIELAAGVDLLVVAPSQPGTLYAANFESFFRSTDHGASWIRLPGSPLAPLDLEVDPHDPETVYVARGPQIFRTEDGGATWVSFESGLTTESGTSETVLLLAADPIRYSTLYAATVSGQIGKSTDRGATWTGVRPSSLRLQSWALDVDPASGAVYAALGPLLGHTDGEGGIWQSMDGGATWDQVLHAPGVASLGFERGAPGRVFAGADLAGVYRSADGGGTWGLSNHGLQAYAISQAAPDPHVPGRIFAAALAFGERNTARGVLMRSDDRGASWTDLLGEPETGIGIPLTALAFHPTEPGTLYVAGRGVQRTTDGGATWESRNRGLRADEPVIALELSPSSPNVLYAIGQSTSSVCGDGICPRAVVFRSTDGGARWRRSRPPLHLREPLAALAVDPSSPSTVYAAGIRLFKSTDGGVTWRQTGRGLRGPVSGLLADPFAPRTLYAVTHFTRRSIPITGIDKSTDGGATWTPADAGLPGWYGIRRLTADLATPGTLYAATDQGVFLSTNGGAAWTVKLKAGLPSGVRTLTVAVDPLDPRTLYTGTAGGGGLFGMTRTP
ncbi:MAG TPA: hypothetical protein VLT87_27255 [Thermoanaerobaculia bacterium]|nr:hypothetical protein [Thermoanaerobaculia bacterium]